ncbi:MAG: hypothetical protein WDA16_13440 [Candidatus Thermoplasmatota archaeon]
MPSPRVLLACVGIGLLLLPPLVSAGSAVDLVPISYHPYPDSADPLGVPVVTSGNRSWGYFETYYGFYDTDRNGFDFPSLVADGVKFVEGAPGGDYDPTLSAYRRSFDGRHALESPFTITVRSMVRDARVEFDVAVNATGTMDETGLALKWVLAEDDVYFRPPPALSNGVFIHRFTARALSPRAPAILDFSSSPNATYHGSVGLHPSWNVDKLYLAVWVQNEAETSARFGFAEVPQAAMHFVTDANATTQDRKAVLIEMFTATWCAACLFGDSALHTLATERGFASTAYVQSSWTYVREPEVARVVGGAALGLLVAALVLAPVGPKWIVDRLSRRREQ